MRNSVDGVYTREVYTCEGIQHFRQSSFNVDGSVSPMPEVGDVLSVCLVCSICGLPITRKDELVGQRGKMVCKECADQD